MLNKEGVVQALTAQLSQPITIRDKYDLPDCSVRVHPHDSGDAIIVCVATERYEENPTLKWFKLTIDEV